MASRITRWYHSALNLFRLYPVKRLIFALIMLATVIILTVWGDRIAGRILDRELAPLLARELGLPVELAPIQARLWQLKARSPKLVMGDPDDPAVVAHEVEVAIPLKALLRGEVRLRSAAARDLMVRPSRWPSSGDPLPDNYQFLEPWLPNKLQLDQGAYVTEAGTRYPVRQAQWIRHRDGGASVDWLEDRSAGVLELTAELESLADLLDLAPIALDISMQAEGEADSTVSLSSTVKPDEHQGYKLDMTLEHAGMQALIVTGHSQAWRLPDHSRTSMDMLDIKQLQQLIGFYSKAGSASTTTFLASSLPRLSLPDHRGKVSIAEIQLGDEAGTETNFEFETSAHGLDILSLSSKGPEAVATGSIGILSDEQGWQLSVQLDLEPRLNASGSIARQFIGADWFWQAGHTKLDGKGANWGDLLHSMQGLVRLQGQHRGKSATPVSLLAQLDNNPEKLVLDQIDIAIGSGRITGFLELAGDERRHLSGNIQADQLDLYFLFDETDLEPEPGMPMPTFLELQPDIDVDIAAHIDGMTFPGLSLTKADLSYKRTPNFARLLATITGKQEGTLGLDLSATGEPGKPFDMTLAMQLERLNIPGMFEQDSLLFSRSSGTIKLHSRGSRLREIFEAMAGDADLTLEVRSDDDWQRPAQLEEKLQFAGNATLVIEDQQILGVAFSDIDLTSTQQEITGKLSVVSQRTPWFIAELQAQKLDVQGLLNLLPETTASADRADLLTAIRDVGSLQVSIDASSVNATQFIQRGAGAPLEDFHLKLTSGPNLMQIDRLDFTLEGSSIASKGVLKWQDKRASFSADVRTSNFNLDRFLLEKQDFAAVPVSGTAALESEGETFSELLANLSGHVDLSGDQPVAAEDLKQRREIQVTIRRIKGGMHADISKLLLGQSDLTGSVRYLTTTPPQLEIKVNSGSFSLVPWEASAQDDKAAAPAAGDKTAKPSLIGSAADTSAKFVGRALSAPSRLLMGPGEAPAGEKYFSSEALPFEKLQNVHASIEGHMNAVTGLDHIVRDLSVNGTLKNGQLELKVNAGNLNGGTADIELSVNARATPPTLKLNTHFDKVGGIPGRDSYPKTGVLSLNSVGNSMAEIASKLNGQAFLELGEGPFNYSNLAFLSADVAARASRTLMPGVEKSKPRLECALTMANFKDGQGITPHGYAARTQEANLIGRIEVDLKKEMLQLQFDSRSREGVGLAVGNVFSNTIQIKGPLTDPQIVPKTTGLAWRGWAAFMTAGLSVVGESVLKRALAAENPCKAIRKDIQKTVCGTDQPLASSPQVCPRS